MSGDNLKKKWKNLLPRLMLMGSLWTVQTIFHCSLSLTDLNYLGKILMGQTVIQKMKNFWVLCVKQSYIHPMIIFMIVIQSILLNLMDSGST